MLNKKTAIFLQVRLNSTRLPAKALLDLNGEPLLLFIMRRLLSIPADVRVILTNNESYPYFKKFASYLNWEIFIGDSQNVLKRFVDAAIYYDIDTIIRATGDNPLVSTEVIVETLTIFNNNNADLAYLSSIPYGSGVEVINKNSLLIALKNATKAYDLEHVTPYIYNNRDKFKVITSNYYDSTLLRSDVRITVDTFEDYQKIKTLIKILNNKKLKPSLYNVISEYDKLQKIEKDILFVIDFNKDNNYKEFIRFLYLANLLKNEYNIFITTKIENSLILELVNIFNFKYIEYNKIRDNNICFDKIFIDYFNINEDDIKTLKNYGNIVTLNCNTKNCKYSDLIISTYQTINSNYIINSKFITANEKKRDKIENILLIITDKNHINKYEIILKALKHLNKRVNIYFLYEEKSNFVNNEIIVTDFKIEDYDLLISTFNKYFYDFIISEIPVIIILNDNDIDDFFKKLEYPYYLKKAKYEELLVELEFLLSQIDKFGLDKNPIFENRLISDKIRNWIPISSICPYCSSSNYKNISRNEYFNMFICNDCGLYYIINLNKSEFAYNDNYFTEVYKQIYGKTYEEDKENIQKLAEKRLEIIKKIKKNGRILDFGSGMGFFSELCSKNGYQTLSLDISKYAVDYIKNILKLDAVCDNEKFLETNEEKFDIITSFYVIEHLKDIEKIIFLFSQNLKSNGLLVLGTPNGAGYSVKYNFSEYIKKHPLDHNFIFTPKFLKKLLKKYGFNKIKIVITGIHPERIVKINFLYKIKFIYNLFYLIIKFLKLGDTFEIYAIKE